MRTLVAATLGWMSLTPAAPAGAVERGYAPVNGLELYYEIHGNPAKDGVPLVLLHGAAPPSRPRSASSSPSSRRRDS